MKRSARDTDSGGERKARRQDPVSCDFCRSKKLKCDRQSPCSNCRARGKECRAPEARTAGANSAGLQLPGNSAVEVGTVPMPAGLDERLRRIENLLAVRHDVLEPRSSNNHDARLREVQYRKSDTRSSPPDKQSLTQKTYAETTNDDAEIGETAAWLEAGVFDRDQEITPPRDIPIECGSKYLTDMFEFSVLNPLSRPRIERIDIDKLVSHLPSREQALEIFDNNILTLNSLYIIMHIPTARSMIEELYSHLESLQHPKSDHLAFVSAILAVGAHYQSKAGTDQEREALKRSEEVWATMSHYGLCRSRYMYSPTIESVQALLLLGLLLPDAGASVSCTVLWALTVNAAMQLRMHQVDSPAAQKEREIHGCNHIEVEVKRRIWWHMTASDWMLIFMSGPRLGTYMIHPAHMRVDYPSNVDDDDLTATSIQIQPHDTPTPTTFCRFRIMIAELTREIADAANAAGVTIDQLDYEIVLCFDRRFGAVYDEIPYFFRIDEESLRRSAAIDAVRPYVRAQRIKTQVGYFTRLCRLHRPFLARGSRDPKYAYSRMTCLRAARMVMEAERTLRWPPAGRHGRHARPEPELGNAWAVIHHLFVCTIVLVMDYCYNREEPQAAERKAEILECFRTLERTQHESTIAKNGLDKLKRVLHEWRRKKKTNNNDDRDGNGNVRAQYTPRNERTVAASAAADDETTNRDKANPNLLVQQQQQQQQQNGIGADAMALPTPAESNEDSVVEQQNMESSSAALEAFNDNWFECMTYNGENLDSMHWESLLRDLEGGMLE